MCPRPLRVFELRSRRKPELAWSAGLNAVSGADSRCLPLPCGQRIHSVSGIGAFLRDQPSSLRIGHSTAFTACNRRPFHIARLSPVIVKASSAWLLSLRGWSVSPPFRCKPIRVARLSPTGVHCCIPAVSSLPKENSRSPPTKSLRPAALADRPCLRTRCPWKLSLPFSADRLDPSERQNRSSGWNRTSSCALAGHDEVRDPPFLSSRFRPLFRIPTVASFRKLRLGLCRSGSGLHRFADQAVPSAQHLGQSWHPVKADCG